MSLLIFQRLISVLSLRALATSSRGLKKDYPWSDDSEKLPNPLYSLSQNNILVQPQDISASTGAYFEEIILM